MNKPKDEIMGPDLQDATTIKTKMNKLTLHSSFNGNELRIGVPKEFYPSGMASSSLKAWHDSIEIFAQKSKAVIVPVEMPNVPYTMSCYGILTSCEIASNFSKYDGLRFGHHTKINENTDYKLESVLKSTRDEALGKVVKGRIVSGNYYLLKK
jgi:aspartyl-tRNA(Asn)/glutamyl-tRNA(Gln) amidotransferase subunit A